MPHAHATPDPSALNAEIKRLRAENDQFRQQAAATNASQARFRTVFENSPLGQKIIDPDLTICQANAALALMLGFHRPDEVVGRRILDFAHPDHRADWTRLQERLWAHRLPSFSLETCLVRSDGSSFWCQVTSVLFEDEGRELGYTTLEDITERKLLALSHERLYDAQETILHLAAHDLKAPVNNIRLVVDLLRRDHALTALAAADRQRLEHLLSLIERSCTEAGLLLQDVLYLGQLEATKLETHRTDLGAFLQERLQIFRVAAQEKGIELELELPGEPLYANIHADKFGRILDNLLTNAMNFTPAGGRIAVHLHQHEGRVRLVVRDTGLGIPLPLQAHVFDKFSAASRPGLYGDTTTGLGLFITKQIVELHQGHIWLESKEHEGTTFFIDLN